MSPTIPKTCRAVVLEKAGAPWVIKEVPVEEPKHGEVLIKVDACGVCHSDSFLQQGAFGEGYAILTPLLCLKDSD
jgi:Zn-dependent alcohol dehydrogenase